MKEKIRSYFTKDRLKQFLYIALGVMIAAFSYSFFLKPNEIVIGGVSGIGVIVSGKSSVSNIDGIVMESINVVLLIISLIVIGKDFFLKTVFGAVTYPLFTTLFNWLYNLILKYYPSFDMEALGENHYMLVIIFSSIIMGLGLGLAMKYDGSTGGTEVAQKIMYEKAHLPYSLSLYLFDGAVIIVGFFILGQPIHVLLYEIIFVYLCGVVMDMMIFSGFNKRAVHIISDKADEIKSVLLDEYERGVTSINVIGEYSQTNKKMIVCLLSSLEYNKLRDRIEKIDPTAFFYCMRASEVRGEGFSYASKSNKVNKKA